MTSNIQPPGQQGSSVRVANRQAQVQARTDVGLGPPRETAPQTYLRPPDAGSSGAQRLLVGAVALLGVAVLLLVLASLINPQSSLADALAGLFGTRVAVQTGVVPPTPAAPETAALPAYLAALPGYVLAWADDFVAPSQISAARVGAGQVATSLLVENGVYRMQVLPGQMGWTLFDLTQTGDQASPQNDAYHLETSATVDPETPSGAAGVLARFESAGNFYLLAVDGSGGVSVQLWRDGAPAPLPATAIKANAAGLPNRLAVADDGQRLRFYVNQLLVAEVGALQLPAGRPGLAVMAPDGQMGGATVDFDWLAVFRPQS